MDFFDIGAGGIDDFQTAIARVLYRLRDHAMRPDHDGSAPAIRKRFGQSDAGVLELANDARVMDEGAEGIDGSGRLPGRSHNLVQGALDSIANAGMLCHENVKPGICHASAFRDALP